MKTTKRDILISKINALDGLTPDEKAQITEYIREKTFGLVWENKPEKAEDVLKESLPVFEEVPERRIFNGEQYPNHIIIEGDNLHALTALRYTHERKIDVIYIDPPYNTGNKDFVYNDSFVDKEDGFRHSKWLSFMEKRLTIAKELLSDKGVIFVSIDDNEMAECKLLLEKIYGGGNFVACAIWQSATDNNPRQITIEHEYIICFAKDISQQNKWLLKSEKAGLIINKYNEIKKETEDIDEIQTKLRKWIKDNKDSLSGVSHYNNVDERGVYSNSSNSSNTKPGGYTFDVIHPITNKPCPKPAFGWRWTEQTFLNYDAVGDIEWGKDESTQPHVKKRIETVVEQFKSIYYEDGRIATKLLENIFGSKKIFNNPKPINLIKRMMAFTTTQNSTVLDFFAGSGTTLHAAMLLNEEDGGHRQCILVTNNENQICENVTYERNRRVINGYPDPKGQMVMGLHANNLRYYRTAFVSQDRTRQNKLRLVRLAVDLLCIKENVYEEQSSFFSIENINKKDFRYFSENGKRLLVIFNEDVIDLIVNVIKQADFEGLIKIYGFSPDSDFYSDEFSDINDRVKICALPAAIYNAYRNIIKRAKDAPPYADDTDDDVETVCTPSLQSQQPTLDL